MNNKAMPLKIFVLISALLLTTSCGVIKPTQESSIKLHSKDITPVSMTSYTKSGYNCFYAEDNYLPSKLEPEEGCYLGAYVLSNSQIDYNAEMFDLLTEKTHALSVYNMNLGDEFPYNWILECASAGKTPYIILRPPNNYALFQENLLEDAAKQFSQISLPVFIDFYPDPHSITKNHKAYAQYYKLAKSTFAEFSPNAIFVFSVDSKNVYDAKLYYPGNDFADWVGIIMYQPLYAEGQVNLRNYNKDLDYLYAEFQRKKPLIISQYALSSYSTFDHRYASEQAANKLTEFYSSLTNQYPRVKAINYMDFNNTYGAPGKAVRDNFSITQNNTMLTAYGEVIADSYFLSDTVNADGKRRALVKGNLEILEDENFKYVPQIEFETYIPGVNSLKTTVINGENYLSTEQLLKYDRITCIVDDENSKIIMAAKE